MPYDGGWLEDDTGATTIAAAPTDIEELLAVNAKRLGAIGDGVADDTAKLQAGITQAGLLGSSLFLPAGTYRITSTLVLASRSALIGESGLTTINFSGVSVVTGAKTGVRASGIVGASFALTSDATKGDYSVTVASATGLNVGDWVRLSSNADYPYDVLFKKGEIKKIRAIVGGLITFEQAIEDVYTMADTAVIRPLTMPADVVVEGIKFVGADTPGDANRAITLEFVNGFNVRDCAFENVDQYCVHLRSSIRGSVADNRMRGVFYDGVTGTIFYGVILASATQWCRIENNHGERLRHLAVTTASSNDPGAPRHNVIDGNVAENMQAGAGGRSWAYEHHGVGEDNIYSNNTADGCYGGFCTRGPGVSFIGNTIRNWFFHAIELHADLEDARDILIADNVIADRTVEGGGASTPAAIYGDLTIAAVIRNVVIRGNEIEIDQAAVQGAGVNILGTGVDATGLLVEDNIFTCAVDRTAYTVAVVPNNATIRMNRLIGADFGIRALGSGQKIIGNEIEDTAVGAGIGIFTDQPNTRIIRNYVRNALTGIRLAVGATGSHMLHNIVEGSSSANAYSVQEPSPGKIIGNVNASEPTSLVGAATLTLPTGNGDVYTVTGNGDITSIAASYAGRRVTLILSGTATGTGITDGSNLKLAGNFVYTPDDTITLVCNGANWYEVSRSTN